jgi:hypothetical protein
MVIWLKKSQFLVGKINKLPEGKLIRTGKITASLLLKFPFHGLLEVAIPKITI